NPGEVARALRAAAEAYAGRLSQVTGDEWNRRGYRSDGREFTVASLTRYGLHEVRHHLGDVGACAMSLEWEQIIIDSPDPLRLGRWWARALDWVIVDENDTEIEIRASADRLPGILIGVDRGEKVVKNRLHLDFRPDDQAAEVARFLELGARHVDVGQTGDEPWVVLADPEGNEFCILSSAAD